MHSIEEINKKIETLPVEVVKAISDSETNNTLVSIGQKHNLPIPTISDLDVEMRYVMLGFIHPNDFTARIKALGIEEEKARAIAHDINEQIFMEIREELKDLYGENKDTEEEGTEQEDIPTKPASPFEARLAGHSTTKEKTVTTEEPPKKPFDPYREPVE